MPDPQPGLIERLRQSLYQNQERVDRLVRGYLDRGLKNPRIVDSLKATEGVAATGYHRIGQWVNTKPTIKRNLEQVSARQWEYSDSGKVAVNTSAGSVPHLSAAGDDGEQHLGRSYANMRAAMADMMGVHVEPGEIKLDVAAFERSKMFLRYGIAPVGLLGLSFVPLIYEIGKKAKELSDYQAKKNSEEHQNLENQTGRYVKAALGLPYREHSIVDIFKSAWFKPKTLEEFVPVKKLRPRLQPEGNSAVWKGRKRPTLYVNYDTVANTYGDSFRGMQFYPQHLAELAETRPEELFRDSTFDKMFGTSIPTPPEVIETAKYFRSMLLGSPNKKYPTLFVRADKSIKETLRTARHEHMHAAQALHGMYKEKEARRTLAALERSPHFDKATGNLAKSYDRESYILEVPAFTAASGREHTGLSVNEVQDLVYRYADDLLRYKGSAVTDDIFRTALPSARHLMRSLKSFSQRERDQIAETIGSKSFGSFVEPVNDTEPLARKVAGHVNLESPTGQFLKKVLNLPYQQHSIVDIFKAARLSMGQPGVEGVWRGKTLPVFYAKPIAVHSLAGKGLFSVTPSGFFAREHTVESFSKTISMPELASQFRSGSSLGVTAPIVGNISAPNLRDVVKHERMHARQAAIGDVNYSYRQSLALERSPYYQKAAMGLDTYGYTDTRAIEMPVHILTSGDKPLGLEVHEAVDIVYRHADAHITSYGAETTNDLYRTAKPHYRKLARELGNLSEDARLELRTSFAESKFDPTKTTNNTEIQNFYDKVQDIRFPEYEPSIQEHKNIAYAERNRSKVYLEQQRKMERMWKAQKSSIYYDPDEEDEEFIDAIDGFRSIRKAHTETAMEHRRQARLAAIPGHVNLESPTGQFLKKVLNLPYQQHSVISMELVTKFFDQLAKDYPALVGRPRRVFKEFYNLQTDVYRYFAQHPNPYLYTTARSLLYGEYMEHRWDFSYQFSPTRIFATFFRSMMGIQKRSYFKEAFSGIENGAEYAAQRRNVRILGGAIGIAETFLNYEMTLREVGRIYRAIFPSRDPQEKQRRAVDRERRKAYRTARRRGERYDPTQESRKAIEAGSESVIGNLLHELMTQFSPRHQLRTVKEAFQDPGDHKPQLAMYATFLGMAGTSIYKSLKATQGQETGARVLALLSHLGKTQMLRGQITTGARALVGGLFGRSTTERAGSFANLGATLLSDLIGKYAGERFLDNPRGRKFAANVFNRASQAFDYFELSGPWVTNIKDTIDKTAKALLKTEAIDAADEEALRIAKGIAAKVGTEVTGLLLEGSLLIPIRHILQRTGIAIDKRRAFRRAHNRAKDLDDSPTNRRKQDRTEDKALRVYLSSYSAPAYSPTDLYSNPDYTNKQRSTLAVMNSTYLGKSILNQISPAVTMYRRVTSGAKAIFQTHLGRKRQPENWKMRALRTQGAPAYSDVDIASNPQYTVPERLFLFNAKKTDRGKQILNEMSEPVTKFRRLSAYAEGMRDPDGHKHIMAEVVSPHRKRRSHHRKEDHDQSLDLVTAVGLAGQNAGNSIKHTVTERDRRHKLKVRSKLHSRDMAPDEKKLHAAYSRYMDYGHEGNELQHHDTDY